MFAIDNRISQELDEQRIPLTDGRRKLVKLLDWSGIETRDPFRAPNNSADTVPIGGWRMEGDCNHDCDSTLDLYVIKRRVLAA